MSVGQAERLRARRAPRRRSRCRQWAASAAPPSSPGRSIPARPVPAARKSSTSPTRAARPGQMRRWRSRAPAAGARRVGQLQTGAAVGVKGVKGAGQHQLLGFLVVEGGTRRQKSVKDVNGPRPRAPSMRSAGSGPHGHRARRRILPGLQPPMRTAPSRHRSTVNSGRLRLTHGPRAGHPRRWPPTTACWKGSSPWAGGRAAPRKIPPGNAPRNTWSCTRWSAKEAAWASQKPYARVAGDVAKMVRAVRAAALGDGFGDKLLADAVHLRLGPKRRHGPPQAVRFAAV